MKGSRITHRAPQPGRPEDLLLIPAVMRPIQFRDIWFGSRTLPPERRLALAVLEEALTDLVRFRFAPGRRAQRLFWQAHDWVASDDREWPFSFVNLCEAFGLVVEPIRHWAFAPVWSLRGALAVHRDEARLGKAA